MKDQSIYNQAVLEIVEDKENELLNGEDIKRMASLAEKFYRQGYEETSKKSIGK